MVLQDGKTALVMAAENGNTEFGEMLVQAGANIAWDKCGDIAVTVADVDVFDSWEIYDELMHQQDNVSNANTLTAYLV